MGVLDSIDIINLNAATHFETRVLNLIFIVQRLRLPKKQNALLLHGRIGMVAIAGSLHRGSHS